MSDQIYEVLSSFFSNDGHYKREEVEKALALRQEITPPLLAILDDVATDPEGFLAQEHRAHIYAAVLLAHFQEAAAHLAIMKAFSLPRDIVELVWGDVATETLPALLFQTCNGSLDAIKDLVRNREMDEYVRASAATALTFAVARGIASREEVIAFLSGLFTGNEARREEFFWAGIVCAIADLHPDGAMDVIRKAYADGLIWPGYVGLDEIEDDLLREKDEVLECLRKEADYRLCSDVHEYLSWMSFAKDQRGAASAQQTAKAQKKKKTTNRKSRKLAKQSKRKNRK